MLNFLKKIFVFRLGQSSAKGAARIFGFRRLGTIIGLVGGYQALKRRRHG
jgi:hypothetical protein